jgi:hypothetical protein
VTDRKGGQPRLYGASWIDLAFRSWQLAADAQAVVGLRLGRLAFCDAAAVLEAQRMVTEKFLAAAEVQATLVSAALSGSRQGPKRAVAKVHKKVRANRRRLSRG